MRGMDRETTEETEKTEEFLARMTAAYRGECGSFEDDGSPEEDD